MSSFDIWLWLKFDDIRSALHVAFAFMGCMGSLVAFVLTAVRCSGGKIKNGLFVAVWSAASFGILCGVAGVLVPSTKEAAIIYAAPLVAQSRFITNDVPAIYTLGVEAIKEKLKAVSVETVQ